MRTYPSWIVMVSMYRKNRNRYVIVGIFIVHSSEPINRIKKPHLFTIAIRTCP